MGKAVNVTARVKEIEQIVSSSDFWKLGSGDHQNMIDELLDVIQGLKTQLDAKLVFINNGWEEERYAMQEELIAKDKVLEWYGEDLRDGGHEARTILSRYKGEDTK